MSCSNFVLEKSSGLEEFGTVQWHLAVALIVAWILIFLCLMKGIKSVGKVVYVTALLPYVLLTVFLVKGLTLPGAVDGILFYIKPDFTRLLNGQVNYTEFQNLFASTCTNKGCFEDSVFTIVVGIDRQTKKKKKKKKEENCRDPDHLP